MIVSQQCLVYQFKCDLCDAGYIAFTSRHLHQRVDEHRYSSSSIGKHFRVTHGSILNDISENFSVLKECKSLTAFLLKCF